MNTSQKIAFSILSLCFIAIYPQAAFAIVQKSSVGIHPDIGDKSPRELFNSDLLALPDRERQAWIHGAASMAAQIVAKGRPETAGCLINWFTAEGKGQEKLVEIITTYPDERATSSLYVVAVMACDDL